MPKRFTATEKWDDPWFSDLSNDGKILFLFLCDFCDIAGFYEKNDRSTSFYTKIKQDMLPNIYAELSKSILIRDRWVWVKNFIKHQKNLPLNPKNNAHFSIILRLVDKANIFNDLFKECLGLDEKELRGFLAPDQPLPRGLGKGKGSINMDTDIIPISPIKTPNRDSEASDLLSTAPIFKDPTIKDLWAQWLAIRSAKGKTNPMSLIAVYQMVMDWQKPKLIYALNEAIRNEWATLVGENYDKQVKPKARSKGGEGWHAP